MRDYECRLLPVRQDRLAVLNDAKRSRTFMTTSGMKTFRVQPMVDNTSITKYQVTSERSQRTPSPHPLTHSTPKSGYRVRCTGKKVASAQSGVNQKSSESTLMTSTTQSHCSSPVPVSRRIISSASSHSTTFNVRSSSCTPTHLYMKEELRSAAKLNRPASVSGIKTPKSHDNGEIPTRFGKPVTLPGFLKSNPHLKDNQLSMGQKQYLWGIARIYSVSKLKKQKQLQYQALLDHEFKRRLEKMGLKEREKVKEMKDYLRYTKFINTYEQRIPRNLRSSDSPERTKVADHIHKHAIKGWTTNVENMAQSSRGTTATSRGESSEKLESLEYEHERGAVDRGGHIYKHVIKGWTMDPFANDAFRDADQNNEKIKSDEDADGGISMTELQNALNEDKSIYRVDISRSRANDREDVMQITKIEPVPEHHFFKSPERGEIPVVQAFVKDSTGKTECNFL